MLCWKMYRAPTRSLLVSCTSTRPVNSRSLKKEGGLRSIGANSIGAVVIPSDTTTVLAPTPLESVVMCGLPAAIAYGPIALKAATAEFPGKAASNCVKPFAVGVNAEPEDAGLPAEGTRLK